MSLEPFRNVGAPLKFCGGPAKENRSKGLHLLSVAVWLEIQSIWDRVQLDIDTCAGFIEPLDRSRDGVKKSHDALCVATGKCFQHTSC